ncbi:GerAB/ArcD/ProY family transporter [Staphylospora marina]|uniref:GerAB/ArcD/ProY family transporter n=1 Tax=Staphylospora marina TaxID=2490858 RepID=UPI000F5B96BA|nr:endospore germination permease [Staphylospora marina]
MIEKGRITSGQMALIMYASTIATGSISLPGITGQFAGRDFWISPIWASASGFLALFLAVGLNRLYPRDNIIGYSRKIIGTIAGSIIGFLYFTTYTHANSFVLREYGELVKSVFLRDTPIVVVMGSIALLSAVSIRGGLESFARCTQFLFVPTIVIWLLTLSFTIQDWQPENIFPIFDHGILPSLRGAVVQMNWFSDFFLISFLLPGLVDQKKALRWGVIAIAGAMITLSLINLVTLLVFGEQSINYTFPYFEVFRYIHLGQFMERIDSFILAIWVIVIFIKLALYHYAIILSVAEWLKLSEYNHLSLPWAIILIAFGFWTTTDFPYLIQFFSTKVVFYSHLMQIVIPFILLLIAWIRRRRKSGSVVMRR